MKKKVLNVGKNISYWPRMINQMLNKNDHEWSAIIMYIKLNKKGNCTNM